MLSQPGCVTTRSFQLLYWLMITLMVVFTVYKMWSLIVRVRRINGLQAYDREHPASDYDDLVGEGEGDEGLSWFSEEEWHDSYEDVPVEGGEDVGGGEGDESA